MKINIFTLSVLMLLFSSCIKGQENCKCETLLKVNGSHKVFSDFNENSKVEYELNNDTLKENYFVVIIYQINRGWAKVSAYSPNIVIKQQGWINLSELGILTSDYPILYKEASKNSPMINIIDYDYDYLDILDCRNDWLKVKYSNKSGSYIGWLPPDNQCANPYTTCN